jgi:hypothetical protein
MKRENEMRNFLSLLITVIFLGISLSVLADDNRCPLTGNAYVFEVDDIRYELSGFVCTFGPGCEAKCDLWFGNFETGPLYHERLPFVCKPGGDVTITVDEMKIPCALNSRGDLECLAVDVSGYTCVRLGTKTWCLPERPGEFQFDLEE